MCIIYELGISGVGLSGAESRRSVGGHVISVLYVGILCIYGVRRLVLGIEVAS